MNAAASTLNRPGDPVNLAADVDLKEEDHG
jgi:hypothetical protein